LGLTVYQPESWKVPETRALWESLQVDLAVVVAYGHILPGWMLDSCSQGAWNLHFSILPRWRGAAPVNHAILAGDSETGVTLMGVTRGLDSGPVVSVCRRPIRMDDTAEGLLALLAEDAASLLRDHLFALANGTAIAIPQEEGGVTLAPKLDRTMSKLDPEQGAWAWHRQVRALQPWPGVEFCLEDTVIKIGGVGRLAPSDEEPGTLHWHKAGAWLSANDGQAMELTLLQRPGKPMQAALQALQPWGGSGKRRLLR
jgi:methionyl-tRNA formyltransferase